MPAGLVLRELLTTLGLEVDAASFAEAQLAVEAIKASLNWMAEAAKLGMEAIKELVVGTAEARHEISEMAVRTGVSTDAIQQMAYAASFSGVSLQELGHSMNMLARKGVRDVQGEMLRLADQISKMPADGRRAELAMERFGRTGARMVPVLARGRAELEELFSEAPVASKDAIEAANHFTEQMNRLRASAEGTWKSFATPLIEALNPILDDLRAWQKENEKLIRSKLAEWGKKVGAAIRYVWSAVKELRSGLLLLWRHLDTVAILLAGPLLTALLVNAGAIAANTAGYISLGIAAVGAALRVGAAWVVASIPLAAIGLAITTILLLVQDLYYYFTGGKSAFGDMIETVKNGGKAMMKDIADEVKLKFREALEKVKGLFSELWAWVVEEAKKAGANSGQSLLSGLRIALGFIPGLNIVAGAADAAANMMGGGASPGASHAAAQGAGAPSVVSNTLQAPISVYVSGNPDPVAVAGAVREVVRDEFRRVHEETKAAVG